VTIEINGMAHVILTVSRFEVAREFYRKLLPEFGMKPVFDGDKFFYCVGARTAIGIEPCDPALAGERFVQQRVGLHHLCLRARSREDVDRCAALLKEIKEPGLEIATFFRRVAVDVDRATRGKQFPELSISMTGEFYLNTHESDSQAWTRVRQSSNPVELQDFVRRYPQSFLVADARKMRDGIDSTLFVISLNEIGFQAWAGSHQ